MKRERIIDLWEKGVLLGVVCIRVRTRGEEDLVGKYGWKRGWCEGNEDEGEGEV